MTTTLPQQTRWGFGARPKSQPAPECDTMASRPRTTKPLNARVRPSKLDNPALIGSILDSFDTLGTPDVLLPDRSIAVSRPGSAGSGAVSFRSGPRLPSLDSPGMEDHVPGARVEESRQDMLAAAPRVTTLRPSRRTSSSSHRNNHRTTLAAPVRSSSTTSYGSSVSAADRERDGSARNKLSSESWVKGSLSNTDGINSLPLTSPAETHPRANSYDAAHSGTRYVDSVELVDPSDSLETAPHSPRIIAPLASPKGRLFLTDTASNDDYPQVEDSPVIAVVAELDALAEDSASAAVIRRVDRRKSAQPPSVRNSIVDSIPTRTSSLRQSSISPNPGRKSQRKSKKLSTKSSISDTSVDSVFRRSKKPIPDSKWADLGEDDQTVMRIRQLRERQQTRLKDLGASPEPYGSSSSLTGFRKVEGSVGNNKGNAPVLPRSESAPSAQALAQKPEKAHKLLGFSQELNARPHPEGRSTSNEQRRRTYRISDELRSPPVRPGTANSYVPQQLTLDYSYVQAVAALQDPRHDPDASVAGQRHGKPYNSGLLPPVSHSTDKTPRRQQKKGIGRAVSNTEHRSGPSHSDTAPNQGKTLSRSRSIGDARHVRTYGDLVGGMDLEPVSHRDSSEIAVEDHLNSPRFTRKVKHPLSGRIIAFSEVGDPQGAVVFMCVGMGLTRFIAGFYDELAYTLRLRLITVDRPGVGASEPFQAHDASGPLNWPEDVLVICEFLGIDRFSLIAHSAGSIYALATALVLRQMIVGKIHLLAPWIPPSQLAAGSYSRSSTTMTTAALPRSQRLLRVLPAPLLRAANASFLTAASASLKPVSRRRSSSIKGEQPRGSEYSAINSNGRDQVPSMEPKPSLGQHRRESLLHMDQYMPDMTTDDDAGKSSNAVGSANGFNPPAIPTSFLPSKDDLAALAWTRAESEDHDHKQRYVRRLTKRTWELATKDSNPATDLLICLEHQREIGFRYTDVQCDVVITHGTEDKRVPVGNVRWLAEQMDRRATRAPGSKSGRDGDSSFADQSSTSASCELRVLEGEGHGLMASPTVMGDVLTEIAACAFAQTGEGLGISTDE